MFATFRWACPICVCGLTRRTLSFACISEDPSVWNAAILPPNRHPGTTKPAPAPAEGRTALRALGVNENYAREGHGAPDHGEHRRHLAEPDPGDAEGERGHQAEDAGRGRGARARRAAGGRGRARGGGGGGGGGGGEGGGGGGVGGVAVGGGEGG